MTRQPIELVRIVLTDRTLQCLDRSVAEGGGVFRFMYRLRVRHGTTGVDTRSSDTGLERRLIGAHCGPNVRSLRRLRWWGRPARVNTQAYMGENLCYVCSGFLSAAAQHIRDFLRFWCQIAPHERFGYPKPRPVLT